MSVINFEKKILTMTHGIVRTKLNRPLVWSFMLIWLEVWLYSVFVAAVSTRGLEFLKYPYFCLPSRLRGSSFSLLLKKCVFFAALKLYSTMIYSGPIDVMLWCGGEEVFCNFVTKSHLFGRPMIQICDIHRYFLVPHPPSIPNSSHSPLGKTGRVEGAEVGILSGIKLW